MNPVSGSGGSNTSNDKSSWAGSKADRLKDKWASVLLEGRESPVESKLNDKSHIQPITNCVGVY